MGVDLDAQLQKVPGQELEAQLAAVGSLIKEVNSIDYLRLGHLDVDDAEVALESVADKAHAEVEEDPETLVGDFEGHHAVRAGARVEVPRRNAREVVEVVGDGLLDLDPVVDEGEAFVFAFAAHDRHASECVEVRADDFSNAIRPHLYFGLLGEDEFRVEGYDGVGAGPLGDRVQGAVGVVYCIGSGGGLAMVCGHLGMGGGGDRDVLEVHV